MKRVIKVRGRKYVDQAKGRALDAVRNYQFFDGDMLSAKSINHLVFAIRALERQLKRSRT